MIVSHFGAIRMGDVLILIPQEGCLIIFRTATINIKSSIYVCAGNIMYFIFEYGHGTQCRTCAASTNYSIRMNKTKMPAILFKYHGTVTMCTAIMPETWGTCARASQCGEKSLRRDVLA
jgi:hypothetical protein